MEQINLAGQQVTLIHFVFTQSGEPERIACMPNMREFHQTLYHPAYQRSNDVRAVTCPSCKSSTEFKNAKELMQQAASRSSRA